MAGFNLHKEDPYHAGLTMGENLINYPRNIGIITSDMLSYKFSFNRVLLMLYTKFMGIDIQNFYLNTHMSRYEYTRLPIDIIPQYTIHEYQIMNKVKMAS